MSEYRCLLPFDTDEPQFSRGFEAGRIWTLLSERPDELVEEVVHGANAEMVLRMAEAVDRPVVSEELGGDWLSVSFAPAEVLDSAD